MSEEMDYDLEALRRDFRAALGDEYAGYYPAALEKQFPRILAKLVDVWKKAEADAYLDGLVTTTRSDRHGFPEDVALELFRLSSLHAGFHLSDMKRQTPWDLAADAEMYEKRSGSD